MTVRRSGPVSEFPIYLARLVQTVIFTAGGAVEQIHGLPCRFRTEDAPPDPRYAQMGDDSETDSYKCLNNFIS